MVPQVCQAREFLRNARVAAMLTGLVKRESRPRFSRHGRELMVKCLDGNFGIIVIARGIISKMEDSRFSKF